MQWSGVERNEMERNAMLGNEKWWRGGKSTIVERSKGKWTEVESRETIWSGVEGNETEWS